MPYNFMCQCTPRPHTPNHCPRCQADGVANILVRHWPPPNTKEPAIIQALFFTHRAISDWRNYMQQWDPRLRYGGVFVHQRPYCSFNPPSGPTLTATGPGGHFRCELGDLLLVFTDHRSHRRTATLFQAKMFGGTWPPPSNQGAQWQLYSTWPVFRYSLPSPRGRQACVRSMPFAGSHDPAANYLELRPNPGNQTIACSEALPAHAWVQFSRTIHRILNGGAGRDFSWSRASANNDWDHLIWDLITVTAACSMPGGGKTGIITRRGDGKGQAWLSTLMQHHCSWDWESEEDETETENFNVGPPPAEPHPKEHDEDDLNGISIIHVERLE